MKAIIYKKYGSPNVLELVEIEKPIPKPNEVLIRIYATSVTSADCMMRRGDTILSRILLGFIHPKKHFMILGTEFSGQIEAIGNSVKKFNVGDDIFGFRGFGTGCYAQYKCMNENESLALKPQTMSYEEAASVVDGASTALFFLKEKANIQKGQKVLINGASGSIGTFAVQIAKYLGAEVTGVCSTKNIELVLSLGADKVLDYTKEDFTKCNDHYDIIFDTVGKRSFSQCKNALSCNGKYLVTVMTLKTILQTVLTKYWSKKKVLFAMSINKTEALQYIKTLIDDGVLKTIIDKQFTLEDLSEAHSYVEAGHKRGNVVIRVMN